MKKAKLEDEQDITVPWWKFRDEVLMQGRPRLGAQTERQIAIDAPGSEAILRRGHWLLLRFAGIIMTKRPKFQTKCSLCGEDG